MCLSLDNDKCYLWRYKNLYVFFRNSIIGRQSVNYTVYYEDCV